MSKCNFLLYIIQFSSNHLFSKNLNSLKFDAITIRDLSLQETTIYVNIHNLPEVWSQNTSVKIQSNTLNYIKNKVNYEKNPLFRVQSILYKNVCIGYIGFYNDNMAPGILYIYYALHPKYWNQGIITISIQKILKIFMPLIKKSYHTVVATVKVHNIGSQKVLEKNGFKVKLNPDGTKLNEYGNGDSLFYFYELKLK